MIWALLRQKRDPAGAENRVPMLIFLRKTPPMGKLIGSCTKNVTVFAFSIVVPQKSELHVIKL